MSGPIQVIPPGLLGMLQLKNVGKLPDELLETLAPVLELRDWLLQANSQVAGPYTTTWANNQTGFANFVTPTVLAPPDRVWWYVHQFTVYASLPLGTDAAQYWPSMSFINTGSVLTVGRASTEGVVAGPNRFVYSFSDPFFAPPGCQLGALLGQVATATAIDASAVVRYTALPV